jgi:hypothetical protein
VRATPRPAHTQKRCPGYCGQLIPVALHACDEDWARLPAALRSALISTRTGNELQQRAAADAAARWWASHPRTVLL